MTLRLPEVLVCLLACVALTACSAIEERRKVDYRNTRTLPPLEVPPDLAPMPETALLGAPASATFSEFSSERKAEPAAGGQPVLPQAKNAHIERDGQTRWLVSQASAESLWPAMRQFVVDAGLGIERENAAAGILETQWVESRMPGSAAATASTRFGWYYPIDSRFKFRIRLERGTRPGTTEVYVSAFGVEKVAGETSAGAAPSWKPRRPDADVEAEMLSLLVAHLAKTQGQARELPGQAPAVAERARIERRGEGLLLQLDDSLERAWRRVGQSLDRIGFTVEDRDRSRGVYYVRYIDPDIVSNRPGFFARLFGADDKSDTASERYQIHLQGVDAGTSVVVKTHEGAPEFGKTSERILTLLHQQLK